MNPRNEDIIALWESNKLSIGLIPILISRNLCGTKVTAPSKREAHQAFKLLICSALEALFEQPRLNLSIHLFLKTSATPEFSSKL